MGAGFGWVGFGGDVLWFLGWSGTGLGPGEGFGSRFWCMCGFVKYYQYVMSH